MNTNEANTSTRFKVGLFTLAGLVLIGAVTVVVNDRPYWWRSCQLVRINVEDATGLKMKSPVRSLGLEIGYLSTVELSETHVSLGICITAPVEVLPSTRAYIRGEGFLGDKFVELKPVKYVGPSPSGEVGKEKNSSRPVLQSLRHFAIRVKREFSFQAFAAEGGVESVSKETPSDKGTLEKEDQKDIPRPGPKGGRQIPVGESSQDVQNLVNRVDSLVNEMTNLTTNLKQAINPEELRTTMKQLNRTLENASQTLSPQGGLNQTAQRTLAKLEDAIEQMRDQLTRINQGKGSVGMLLNDPTYAKEIHDTIRNVNKLLTKVTDIRFFVEVGGERVNAYDDGRGWFRLTIWPKPERYYLLGISVDPRGRLTRSITEIPGQVKIPYTQTEYTGILITAMLGKVFYDKRLDLSIGALNGDGAVSAMFNLGPTGSEEMVQFRADFYSRGAGLDARTQVIVRPWSGLFVKVGLESFRSVNDLMTWSYGAGVSFEDEDIKLLFALR